MVRPISSSRASAPGVVNLNPRSERRVGGPGNERTRGKMIHPSPKQSGKVRYQWSEKNKTSTKNSDLIEGLDKAAAQIDAGFDALDDKARILKEDLQEDIACQVESLVVEMLQRRQEEDAKTTETTVEEPSEPPMSEDQIWTPFREHVRHLCNKTYGDATRLNKIQNNVNFLINKYGISQRPSWADKASDIVKEEIMRYRPPFTSFELWLHKLLHSHYGSTLLMKMCGITIGTLAVATFNSTLRKCLWWLLRKSFPLKTALFTIPTLALVYRIYQRFVASKKPDITLHKSIEDTCCFGVPLNDIDEKAYIDTSQSNGKCVPRTYEFGITIARDSIAIYRSCCHNEEIAVVNRQLIPLLVDDTKEWNCATELFTRTDFFKQLPNFRDVNEQDLNSFLCRFPSSKRAMYEGVLRSGEPVSVNHRVKAFVKSNEINFISSHIKMHPRHISGSEPEHILEGVGFWVWWKELLPLVDPGCFGNRYNIASGRSAESIGSWVSSYERMGWYFYEGDFSRFDGRTSLQGVLAKEQIYRLKGMSGKILDAFIGQRSCDGKTASGISFGCPGKIRSGDIDTSGGDNLLNMIIFTYCLSACEFGWAMLCNGDDVIIVSEHPLQVDDVVGRASHLNHKLELIARDDVDDLEFCSSRFWNIGETRVLGPKVGRLLGKSLMFHTYVHPSRTQEHIKGVLTGFYHYRWLPGLDIIMGQHQITHGRKGGNEEWKIWLDTELTVDINTISEQFEKIYQCKIRDYEELMHSIDWTLLGQSIQHPIFDQILIADGCKNDDDDTVWNKALSYF